MQNIYAISVGDTGPVKVGISADPTKRLKSLQTACPYPLVLATVLQCPVADMAADLERQFHRQHARCRTSGEWFGMTPSAAIECMEFLLTAALVFGAKMPLEEALAAVSELRNREAC